MSGCGGLAPGAGRACGYRYVICGYQGHLRVSFQRSDLGVKVPIFL